MAPTGSSSSAAAEKGDTAGPSDDTPGQPAGRPPGQGGGATALPNWAAFGILVSLLAIFVSVGLGVYVTWAADQRLRVQASTQALYEWHRRQPPNARPCLRLVGELLGDKLAQIIKREATPLPAALSPRVAACFSDIEVGQRREFYNDEGLTTSSLS